MHPDRGTATATLPGVAPSPPTQPDTVLGDPGFADISVADWEAAAEATLRGTPLSALRTTLLDGIDVAPLYTMHRYGTDTDPAGLPGHAPFTRGAAAASGGRGWEVRQTHDLHLSSTPDAVAVDTTSGVGAVTVARGWDAGHGTALLDAAIGDAASAGVTIHLQAGTSPAHAEELLETLQRRGADPATVTSWLGLDPIAATAAGWASTDGASLAQAGLKAARCGADIARRWPSAVPLEVDGSVFADAGAADTTELAAMLACGVAWLRALCDAPEGPGLDASAAARLLGFTLSAGPDAFLMTAKCRALRTCWTRVLSICGLHVADGRPLPLCLHAVTSTAMLSARDQWVNMLRATTATFGAANGGVDAITVRPFNSVSTGPASSELGWRVAANTQLILRHESRIGTVIDPAGGSWYLEALTKSVASTAWERFRGIEAAGGIYAVMASGECETMIAADRQRRNEQLAAGERVLVGVTDFVAHDDAANGEAEAATSHGQAQHGEQRSGQVFDPAEVAADAPGGGLGTHRWAAPFETAAKQP